MIIKLYDKKTNKVVGYIKDDLMNITTDSDTAMNITFKTKLELKQILSDYNLKLDRIYQSLNSDSRNPIDLIAKQICETHFIKYNRKDITIELAHN